MYNLQIAILKMSNAWKPCNSIQFIGTSSSKYFLGIFCLELELWFSPSSYFKFSLSATSLHKDLPGQM